MEQSGKDTERRDVAYLVVVQLNEDNRSEDANSSLLAIVNSQQNSEMVLLYVPPEQGFEHYTAAVIGSRHPTDPKEFAKKLGERLRPNNKNGMRARFCEIDYRAVTTYDNAEALEVRVKDAALAALSERPPPKFN